MAARPGKTTGRETSAVRGRGASSASIPRATVVPGQTSGAGRPVIVTSAAARRTGTGASPRLTGRDAPARAVMSAARTAVRAARGDPVTTSG